ncbi:MAG TPA: hypothetical protein VJT31_04655 [Rugosimonospora sp.]|nr:hypothetical protein [Rugosimonospora sp.]
MFSSVRCGRSARRGFRSLRRALARAVRSGDGYIGQHYDLVEALDLAEQVHKRLAEAGRTGPFELMLSVKSPTVDGVFRLAAAGVTSLVLGAPSLDASHTGDLHAVVRSLKPSLELMDGVRRRLGR